MLRARLLDVLRREALGRSGGDEPALGGTYLIATSVGDGQPCIRETDERSVSCGLPHAFQHAGVVERLCTRTRKEDA